MTSVILLGVVGPWQIVLVVFSCFINVWGVKKFQN